MLVSDFKSWILDSKNIHDKYLRIREKTYKNERFIKAISIENNEYKSDIIAASLIFFVLFGVFTLCDFLFDGQYNYMLMSITVISGLMLCYFFLLAIFKIVSKYYFQFNTYKIKRKIKKHDSVFNVFNGKEKLYNKILNDLSVFDTAYFSQVERALNLMKKAKEKEETESMMAKKKKDEELKKILDEENKKKEKELFEKSRQENEHRLHLKRIEKIKKEHNYA